VGLGMWKWGYPSYDGSRVGEHEGFQILDRALELGVVHWDTANSYNAGSGNCERLLGRYFSSRGAAARDMVVLATKVHNSVRREHELEREFSPNEAGSSRKYLMMAVEGCLRRLQTERIDVLYHHWPDVTAEGEWETPLEETWGALDDLVRQGKVLYLAVSNRSLGQLQQECRALAGVSGSAARPIVAVQNRYNLLERARVASGTAVAGGDEGAFLDYLGENGVGLVPMMPLAVGMLTGRYRKGQIDETGRLSERAGEELRQELLTERNFTIVEKLLELARRRGCTLAQLAVAWLLRREAVCSVISGVTRMEHLEDNVRAIQIQLSRAELEQIDALTRP
jgi:L-glyceraldehyde 3-phosphate reductase